MKRKAHIWDDFFARQIVQILFVAVLVFSLITMCVYNILSPRLFAGAKQREMMPRVQFAAQKAALAYEQAGTWFPDRQVTFIGADELEWGGAVVVLDKECRVVYSNSEAVTSIHDVFENDMGLHQQVKRILEGEDISMLLRTTSGFGLDSGMGWRGGRAIVGAPVSIGGDVIGAALMISELDEIMSSASMLVRIMSITCVCVLALMIPFALLSSKRVTKPLKRMRDAALKMADGDFTVKADVCEGGMIGELAGTLNFLSTELDGTISALTLERNRALRIINALEEGILLLDREGRVLHENAGMETLMAGFGGKGTMPEEAWQVIHDALCEKRNAQYSFAQDGMQLCLNVLLIDDGRSGAVAVLRDDTHAFRLEQTRREYVANVSHELRTPLTAVRALIELLCDGMVKDEETRQELYHTILRETLRLSRLVDDMLRLSRLQSGTTEIAKEKFSPEPLLREVTGVYSARAADSGHILRLALPEDGMPDVFSNADRAEQVLMTLLDNAVRHTPAGTEIVLRAQTKAYCVCIIVDDNGQGIAPEDLPHVFERFYKADKAHAGGGNGLGLSIAQEVIARMGEEIGVKNRAGGGASFWFTLRRADCAQQEE